MAINPLSASLGLGGGMSNQFSPAGQALGFGGDQLASQVKDETDEERKKRLLEQQRMSGMSPVGSALMNSFYG
jgi:hypothetical protein